MKFNPASTAVDVLERLISRDTEMSPVWLDIARQALTGEQCWNLLAQIFLAGVY